MREQMFSYPNNFQNIDGVFHLTAFLYDDNQRLIQFDQNL